MGGAQILSSGSLREMHRVRSVEETWTSGTAIGFGSSRIKDKTYVGHGGGYLGNTTNTLIQLDDKVGGHRAHETQTTPIRAAWRPVDGDSRVAPWRRPQRRNRSPSRGIHPGPGSQGSIAVRGPTSKSVLMNDNWSSSLRTVRTLDDPLTLEPLGRGQFRFVAKDRRWRNWRDRAVRRRRTDR
jgi:hypothetical protein